ncbi:Site-specific recombinase XerD [Streptomyces zhaozhouensis]|uniref:Site-specific recombinase XerD n=1 Tax=Streptomyces zhaozhouensis TaxID=1300267 RepID=A0A286DU77_9ACTN|nr:site-specific integrase [Streptomyces zhaozhouensis]SOD62124.1 Site-specific recombinase XerD [Streptomyces zhaozhouensis]
MTAIPLPALLPGPDRREARDRLELLTALLNGPSVDPVFREDVIRIPDRHPLYPWHCAVVDCERPRWQKKDLCAIHAEQWRQAQGAGMRKSDFVHTAEPLKATRTAEEVRCRICPERPAFNRALALCHRHRNRWRAHHRKHGEDADFEQWLAGQRPCPSYGHCCTRACEELAASPLGLCQLHLDRYRAAGRPGGAGLPDKYVQRFELHDLPVPVSYDDETAFRQWCAFQPPVMRVGEIDLRGLRPLLKAEIKWGLHAHGQGGERRPWELPWIQGLVNSCHRQDCGSLLEMDLAQCTNGYYRMIAREMLAELRLVYLTPAGTREDGFLQTQLFGVLFPKRSGYFPLTDVPQRWLRDLLWEHLAGVLRSPQCPRTSAFMDNARKSCVELGTFLESHAPAGGHDPAQLTAEHVERYVAEVRRRERMKLPALTLTSRDRVSKVTITPIMRQTLFNGVRLVLRTALETGSYRHIGLSREFIVAMPVGGRALTRSRSPFPDEVARALADPGNLERLAADHDPGDQGMRDIWEAIVYTGRRAGEIINLKLECLGRYNGLPMLWHDQTKVGNYDQAIRIPEPLYGRLAERQRKTLDRFAERHGGQQATPRERAAMALFPSTHRSRDGHRPLSYNWFQSHFRPWVDDLDLGNVVPHQARHTLATRLLRHGASLSHIRRYLGQVSERMAEHYAKVAVSEIEDVLQHVWVAGPGAADPGELLSSPLTPLHRHQAEALAIDLSRRSTPTEGGFCTFQPVVDGGACPFNLDCENCDKFVMSGADLLYWRRKREQWHSIAERAPDDTTADYLHEVFAPTARAIDGLEKTLAGLGLLDDALALDLRRPQDYFHRLWSTGFKAADLARTTDDGEPTQDEAIPA